MRLTIITITLALAALTACSPLAPPAQFDRAPTVDISEAVVVPAADPCTPSDEGGGSCLPPEDTTVPGPGEGTDGCESGTFCAADPNPPTPNICEPGDSEGGLTC